MNYGKAMAIFIQINSEKYSDIEFRKEIKNELEKRSRKRASPIR